MIAFWVPLPSSSMSFICLFSLKNPARSSFETSEGAWTQCSSNDEWCDGCGISEETWSEISLKPNSDRSIWHAWVTTIFLSVIALPWSDSSWFSNMNAEVCMSTTSGRATSTDSVSILSAGYGWDTTSILRTFDADYSLVCQSKSFRSTNRDLSPQNSLLVELVATNTILGVSAISITISAYAAYTGSTRLQSQYDHALKSWPHLNFSIC